MTTSIASNQATIVDTIQNGAGSSSRTRRDKVDGDSFSQVLKEPAVRKNTRTDDKIPSKSSNKPVEDSQKENITRHQQPVEATAKKRQKLDVEPVDRGVIEAAEDGDVSVDSTAEAVLLLVNTDGEPKQEIFTNNLLTAEQAILLPNKAIKGDKGGNILPVIEPNQRLTANALQANATNVANIPRVAELLTEQLQPQGLKDVVLIQPVVEKATNAPLVLAELTAKQKQSSEADLSASKIDIKSKSGQSGAEFDLSKLDLADFISKESKLINPTTFNRTAVIESLTDVRTETIQQTTATSNAVANTNSASSTNIQKTDTGLLTLMMQTTYKPGSKEWSESFSRNIAMMALNNNKSAEIRMDPPDLGSIQVKINQLGNETNLQFQVQNSDTKQAIEASIQRLKESLAEQGFVNINVDIQQGEQSQSEADRTAQQSGLKANGSDLDTANADGEIATLQPVAMSGIDFFA